MVAGDAVSQAESAPGEPMSPVAASDAQLAAGHLLRCPQCGALNGRSVQACWACEADLTNLVPLVGAGAAAVDATSARTADAAEAPPPDHPPAAGPNLDMAALLGSAAWDASEPKRTALPVLTTPVSAVSLMPVYPEVRMTGGAFTQPPRPRWGLFAIVGIALLFAGGAAYEVLRASFADSPRAAFAAPPPGVPDAALAPPPGVPVHPPGDLSHVDEALRTAEMLTRTPPVDAAADVPPLAAPNAGPARARTGPAARQARTRSGSNVASARAPASPTDAAPPQRVDPSPAARPAAAPPVGPCTATVAALGLCASPNQPKE
jgi:hypothetical protein